MMMNWRTQRAIHALAAFGLVAVCLVLPAPAAGQASWDDRPPLEAVAAGAQDPIEPAGARTAGEPGDGRPILLRFERAAGHGAGTPMSMLLDQYTDYYSFLFGELGVRFDPAGHAAD